MNSIKKNQILTERKEKILIQIEEFVLFIFFAYSAYSCKNAFLSLGYIFGMVAVGIFHLYSSKKYLTKI